MIRILYVDDEEDLLELSKMFLERSLDIKIDVALSAKIALEMLELNVYDAIISDYQMPEVTGIDFLKDVRGKGNYLPFILFTGRGREEVVIEALNSGADFYVQKGGNPVAQFKELEHKVRESVRRYRAEKALNENEKRLAKAHALGNTGCWEYDFNRTPQMMWASVEGVRMFGYDLPSGNIPVEKVEACIPNKMWVREQMWGLIREGKKYDIIYTIYPAGSNQPRIINSIAELEYDEKGNPDRVVGLIKDITEQVISEDVLRRDQQRNKYLFELAQTSGLTSKDIAKKAMDYCIELTESDMGYIAFLNEDETVLWMQHYSETAMDKCRVPGTPMIFKVEGTGLWAEAMRQRRPVITNDYDSPNPLKRGLPHGHVGIHRHLSIPVFDRGKIVAVAGMANKGGPYTDQDVMNVSLLMDGMWRIIRRNEAEEAMRESEVNFRTYIEMSPGEHFLIGEDGRIIECNPQACASLNMTRQEILGLTAWEITARMMTPEKKTPAMEGMFNKLINEALETGKSPMFKGTRTIEIRQPDGSIKSSQMMMFPIESEKGWRIGIFTWDITSQRKAENELKENRIQLTMSMDMAKLVYWEYDVEGGFYTFNDRFYEMYGTAAQIEGGYRMPHDKYFNEFIHPDDQDFARAMEEQAKTCHPSGFHFEHRIVRRDGEVRTITVYPCVTQEENGQRQKVFGVNQDITDIKRIERSLKKANESLNLLTSITRHDISNQLLLQRGYLDILKASLSDPELLNKVSRVEESIKTVQKQVEFTKDYEQMGTIEPKWYSLEKIFHELHNKRYAREIVLDDCLHGLDILADPMFNKVIYNLVENSIRYGGKPISIKVSCVTNGDDLIIVYEDDGQGIVESDKESIFRKGFGKGTGLGLFLSREILSITGITIKENGMPGSGARFVMTVPSGHYRFK